MTNNSIFTRVLALVLCFIMVAGMMTSCFQEAEPNQGVSTTTPEGSVTTTTQGTTKPNADTTTTTGDSVNNDPVEDPVDPNELFSGSAELDMGSLIYGSLANDVFIGGETGVAAMIPADVKVEAGASSLTLSVTKVEEETLGDTLSNLDVHVSGIALDNTVPMTVMLGAILPSGLANTELKLYHVENGAPVLMTRVNSVDEFAIHNQYVYDAETGNVTIFVASFSVFTAVKATADVWDGKTVDYSWYNTNDTEFTLTTAAQFAGFRDIVDGTAIINETTVQDSFAGKTVTLATDIDLDKKLFNPIGGGWAYNGGNTFNGTFDGGNHTIYNLRVNGWELDETGDKHSGTSMGAGLFSSLHNATVKNLAVVGSELIVETTSIGIIAGVAQGKCAFENIVVSNATLGNYQMRNGGIVGDIYVIASDNVPKDDYSHTFTNIVVDSSVKLSSMWGDFDTGNGGVIGGKYGSSKVLMQNVIVAAELDVFSDVTAAYQWYAYRRCGMLVGYTGQNSPKQATNAAADFLKCENVSVYYGNWTNYTYYQFSNQTDAEGTRLWNSNYPWVRAEESPYNGPFSNVRYGNPVINGEKINTLELAEAKCDSSVTITFNQLYGGGQGVYGTNEHAGVTVNYSLTKTIYIENNLGWENPNLYYWFANGDDTWTTLVDPITLTEENGVYRVDLPAYAFAFKITADGENETRDFYLSEVTENETYKLDFAHVHNFRSNICDCGASKQELEYQFTFGENGEAKHSDGGNMPENYEENGYTLTLEGLSNVYGNARDAKGNSCIKLGTSSAVGEFSFTVPENIDKVIIYVAGREAKDAKVSVNGVEYEITTHSDDGEYTAITVDTSENKTVSFTTVSLMGEERCMINTISFVTTRIVEIHECNENEEIPAVDPTCTETGLTAGKKCSVCGKVMVEQGVVAANGHTETTLEEVEATCTKNGLTAGSKCSVCKEILVEQTTIPSIGHNYVGGTCANCGEAFPTTAGTYTYVFANYTEGVQYAKSEEHKLDENVTITTYDCHFTDELRIYSSSTNNGYAIIYSVNPISEIGVNAGNKVDTINIYGSNDGVTWTEEPIATISVTSTSYKDYTVKLEEEYKYIKLDVAGSNQVRIKSMTLTTVPDCAHASTTTETVAPTCTEAGYTVTKCASCGKEMSRTNEVAATGHVNTTTTTVDASCTVAGSVTVTCDDCGTTVSTETIKATGHNYVDGTCTGCGESQPTEHTCESVCATCGKCTDKDCAEDACADKCEGHTVAPTTTTVSKSHTEMTQLAGVSTSSNGGSLNGKSSSLDDNITVTFAKGNSTSNPAYYSESIRLYQNGATLTIKAAEGCTIKTIKITVANNSAGKGPISVENGTASALTNLVYTITANEGATQVVITTTGTTSSTRLYVANIEVEYASIGSGSEDGETTCEHTNTTTNTVAATCTTAGSTTVTCVDCGETVSTEETEALGHTTDNGVCGRCGETIGGSTPAEPTVIATFSFGANGSASHSDGSEKTSYTETNNGYTLTLSGMSKVYGSARDAKGNSALKLGTGSAAGKFSFTVADDVTKVVIYVAQYKANTTKITVNGTSYTITTASNNGEYTAIEIDTSTNKTVSFTTTSGGYRAMVNTIEFYK